jgi:hypothetical protein
VSVEKLMVIYGICGSKAYVLLFLFNDCVLTNRLVTLAVLSVLVDVKGFIETLGAYARRIDNKSRYSGSEEGF